MPTQQFFSSPPSLAELICTEQEERLEARLSEILQEKESWKLCTLFEEGLEDDFTDFTEDDLDRMMNTEDDFDRMMNTEIKSFLQPLSLEEKKRFITTCLEIAIRWGYRFPRNQESEYTNEARQGVAKLLVTILAAVPGRFVGTSEDEALGRYFEDEFNRMSQVHFGLVSTNQVSDLGPLIVSQQFDQLKKKLDDIVRPIYLRLRAEAECLLFDEDMYEDMYVVGIAPFLAKKSLDEKQHFIDACLACVSAWSPHVQANDDDDTDRMPTDYEIAVSCIMDLVDLVPEKSAENQEDRTQLTRYLETAEQKLSEEASAPKSGM